MSRIKNSQYIYAVSRIRVIETRLLSHAHIRAMVEAPTPEDTVKMLADAGYTYLDAEAAQRSYYEDLLIEEHKKLYRLLRKISPQPEVFQLFLQPHDFNNIKVILKAEFAGLEDFTGLLKDKGFMALSKLEKMMRDRKFDEMPPIMRKAVEEAISDFYHTRDPQTVDLILDRACHERMGEMAAFYKNQFLTDFTSGNVDILNVSTILRMQYMKGDEELAKRVLMRGGYIPAETLIKNFSKSPGEILSLLKQIPCMEISDGILEVHGQKAGKLLKEALMNDFINGLIMRSKRCFSGLEPLIGYLLAKEREIRNVRTVLIGKFYGLSKEKIKERLMGLYA